MAVRFANKISLCLETSPMSAGIHYANLLCLLESVVPIACNNPLCLQEFPMIMAETNVRYFTYTH